MALSSVATAVTLPPGFQESVVFTDLAEPTSVAFAVDGRVFVSEKSGLIKVYPSVDVDVPTIFADLRTNVHNYWDRGLLSIALHPDFPNTPYVYALYTLDAEPGGTPPRWGVAGITSDGCPNPPGGTTDGCVVGGRLSRLRADGNQAAEETALIDAWCQQFPSHSIGSLEFGTDGALYVSGGEGSNFFTFDYGQYGSPLNPCGDPPVGVGGTQIPATSEGGSLRSQSLRRAAGEPAVLSGAILRVDPLTGAALPDNPLYGSTRSNADRIIAYGLRNPFRIALRPGTNEMWIGDVGSGHAEEINRIADVHDTTVENFGWPCYEGRDRNDPADRANVALCESLYTAGSATQPSFAYLHATPLLADDGCTFGAGTVVSGLRFYNGGSFPPAYAGALFFSDLARRCIWQAPALGAGGAPDFSALRVFAVGASSVDLKIGPQGDLYYVDFYGHSLRRIHYSGVNHSPSARLVADATSGPVPFTVHLDASTSSDPDAGDVLSFAWDADGDGDYDDGSAATLELTYTVAGSHAIRVRVTDSGGERSVAEIIISASNTAPVVHIAAPSSQTQWSVGQLIEFSGGATDAEDGTLPASRLSWSISILHCGPDCHAHPLVNAPGVSGGSLFAPDHEYPSHLQFTLTATDFGGLTSTDTLIFDPATVDLSFVSMPTGMLLTVGETTTPTPLTVTAIVGSRLQLEAASPQGLGSGEYHFESWSDAGPRTHEIQAPAADTTYTATFVAAEACTAQSPQCAVGGRAAGKVTYYGSSEAVPGAVIVLRATDRWLTQTDAAGEFMSPDIACDPCDVLPLSAPSAGLQGLTAFDAVAALQGSVGLRTLSSAARLACDTSGDGRITAIDASFMLQKRVGIIQDLPAAQRCGSEWLFNPLPSTEPERTCTPPALDANQCVSGTMQLPLHGITAEVDFEAILIGDCNGSWRP